MLLHPWALNVVMVTLIFGAAFSRLYLEGMLFTVLYLLLLLIMWRQRDTLEKGRQAELRLNQERYRSVVESQMNLIACVAPDGKTLTFKNTAFIDDARWQADKTGTMVDSSLQAQLLTLTPEQPVTSTLIEDDRGRWFSWQMRAVYMKQTLLEYQLVGHESNRHETGGGKTMGIADAGRAHVVPHTVHTGCSP